MIRAPTAQRLGWARLLQRLLGRFRATLSIAAPALATAMGLAGAVLGVRLTGVRKRARRMVPLAAGMAARSGAFRLAA